MNKEWSEQNKRMQSLIKKADTFNEGKDVLFELRNDLMNTMLSFKTEFNREDFDAMASIRCLSTIRLHALKFMYPCTNNCEWFCQEPYTGKPHVRICEGLAPKDACLLDYIH